MCKCSPSVRTPFCGENDCYELIEDDKFWNGKAYICRKHELFFHTDLKKCPACVNPSLYRSGSPNHSHDNVNHPAHYNSSGIKCACGRQIECIDITRTMDFNIGNAVKYLWRYKHKNGLEDLKKARWYLDDAIKQEENKNGQ